MKHVGKSLIYIGEVCLEMATSRRGGGGGEIMRDEKENKERIWHKGLTNKPGSWVSDLV